MDLSSIYCIDLVSAEDIDDIVDYYFHRRVGIHYDIFYTL